eukprot:NODE_25845_length_573_cov_4.125561.p6 GENE.NODE_25845_length_573_cov_4.125561~~NODE_25845_length_573_cov_4.125561.p6  ORF type:complete len:55 (-),score=10.05 NODE_25845_length_573_cov_4.125561:292-456(-)
MAAMRCVNAVEPAAAATQCTSRNSATRSLGRDSAGDKTPEALAGWRLPAEVLVP